MIVVVFASCKNNSVYKGYTETDSGLYYKLQMIGDGKLKPVKGDYLQLIITYKTEKDSIFFDTYSSNPTGKVILPFGSSSFKGSFEEGLVNMNAGDSVSFIVSADSLFQKFFKMELPIFIQPNSSVKMDVKLHRILNESEYQKELSNYQNLMEDSDIEEYRKLQSFLDANHGQYTALENGMFYQPIKQGVGNNAEAGCLVKINYKGYFLNGKCFESTYDSGQSFEFKLGEQGQVIPGFETAIYLLNEGGKAKFIIPSQLAFGKTGSSTGIIPPYCTLIYEMELISLIRK
jgi:FKBP-type peptidyl-prolyl cis-trans isomerase